MKNMKKIELRGLRERGWGLLDISIIIILSDTRREDLFDESNKTEN